MRYCDGWNRAWEAVAQSDVVAEEASGWRDRLDRGESTV